MDTKTEWLNISAYNDFYNFKILSVLKILIDKSPTGVSSDFQVIIQFSTETEEKSKCAGPMFLDFVQVLC